jgi:YVTN family beta-propeller protein
LAGSLFLLDQTEARLYCADYWSHFVAVLDVSADSIVRSEIEVGSEPWVLCVAAKANKVYAGDMARGSVYSLDCASGRVKEVRLPGKEVRALCYDSLDNKVYCASSGAHVHVIDCTTDSVVAAVSAGSMPKQMTFVPRRDRMYVASTGHITAIDCRNDSAIRTVPLHGSPQYPLYNPERDEVLVPCPDYDVHYVAIVDCSTNTWVDTLAYTSFVPIYCQSVKKIYMLGVSSSDLPVLDAASDSLVATIPGVKGSAGAVNETDSKVYAILPGLAPFVAVVDAKADTVTRVITSIFACSVTHDAINDKVYVTGCTEPGKVFVLDGPTDSILDSIPVLGHRPYASVWNPSDGRVYVANLYSGSISVFRDSMVPGAQDRAADPSGRRSATIMRQLNLPSGVWSADVYDITGRRVARLGPGLEDVRRLGVGVYFVAEPGRSGASKIVVVR